MNIKLCKQWKERMARSKRKKGNWRRKRRADIYTAQYKEAKGRM